LSRKDLRAAEGGWESPGKTRFGSWRVVTWRYQTDYRHNRAGAPGAADPALQAEYGSGRQCGQVTKVSIGAPILRRLPEREWCEPSAFSRQPSALGDLSSWARSPRRPSRRTL